MATCREATAWDGHTVSAEGAVRAARAKITLDDQIKEINRQKGLMADKDAIGPSASGVQFNTIFLAQYQAQNLAQVMFAVLRHVKSCSALVLNLDLNVTQFSA